MKPASGLRSLHLRRVAPRDERVRLPDELGRWIAEGRRPFADFCVASLVPEVFEAYVRILHPAWSLDRQPVRWDAVAQWSGRSLHRLAQWERLAAEASDVPSPPPFLAPPDPGGLPPFALAALVRVLRGFTTMPSDVFLGIWDGYGSARANRRERPVLELDERVFLVQRGDLAVDPERGWRGSRGEPVLAEPPTLIWPADRSWFVAADPDLDSTYVGGSGDLVRAVRSTPALEAWPVEAGDDISIGSDRVNL